MIRSLHSCPALLLAACSSSADAEAASSALTEIETLRPVIACIAEQVEGTREEEVWSGGAPDGPAQSKRTLQTCASDIEFDFGRSIENGDPHAARDAVMFWALMSFGDYRDHLDVEDFDAAMKAARCAEARILGDQAKAGSNSRFREEVIRDALIACVPGVAKMTADPSSKISRREGLAFSIANINLNHIRLRASDNAALSRDD